MSADTLFAAITHAVIDVAGRERAFSSEQLTNEELREIRDRVSTLISMNLKPKEKK